MYYHKRAFAKKNGSSGESLTTETYIIIVKNMGFSVAELKFFDIGDILDVANEYISGKSDVRQATQEDFDRF